MNTPLAPHARDIDIEQLADFDALVAGGATSMHGWHFQSVDLRGRSAELAQLHVAGAVFMGCTFAAGVEVLLRGRGALIFPSLPHVPFNAYRGHLYTGNELFGGIETGEYEQVLDARIYQWTMEAGQTPALLSTLATAMHDHAIYHALDAVLVDGTGLLPGLDCLGQQPLGPLFTDPPAPSCQRGWVNWWQMLKESLAGEVLIIRILDPAGDHRLIR